MTFAFWQTPQWLSYLSAYGKEHESHDGGVIVSLGPDEAMWRNLRKGHRSDVKKALKTFDLVVADEQDHALFPVYQHLHMLDAGRVTRPQETFDLMSEWLGEHGVLFLARNKSDSQYVGAAYFLTNRNHAYYASAARLPGAEGPIGHFLVWSAMRWLADLGYESLDLGPSEGSIAHFKRGFCST